MPTSKAFDHTGPNDAIIIDFLLYPNVFLTITINITATSVAKEPTTTSITPNGLAVFANTQPNTRPKPYFGSIKAKRIKI